MSENKKKIKPDSPAKEPSGDVSAICSNWSPEVFVPGDLTPDGISSMDKNNKKSEKNQALVLIAYHILCQDHTSFNNLRERLKIRLVGVAENFPPTCSSEIRKEALNRLRLLMLSNKGNPDLGKWQLKPLEGEVAPEGIIRFEGHTIYSNELPGHCITFNE